MSQTLDLPAQSFVERRGFDVAEAHAADRTAAVRQQLRRAFPRSPRTRPAIDEYKLRHRRRFITYEETLSVIQSLGYRR